MRALIVKTSSLGDVIHTLPAVTDACTAHPSLRFDWLVEEAYAEIPAWHPGVGEVISVALRRWRKKPLARLTRSEFAATRARLRVAHYDAIIDAQGLIKSAALACLARGPRYGFDARSAREPLAAAVYQHRIRVPRHEHAIERTRRLFARALGYSYAGTAPDFGISESGRNYADDRPLILVHGTTWPSKRWPIAYWQALAALAADAGHAIRIPWGNEAERDVAQEIAAAVANAEVLPRLPLDGLRSVFDAAWAVVAVDSGLAHLASAAGAPTLTLYGATNALLTGCRGARVQNLRADFTCSPCLRRHCNWRGESVQTPACYETLAPESVWLSLNNLVA